MKLFLGEWESNDFILGGGVPHSPYANLRRVKWRLIQWGGIGYNIIVNQDD